MADSPADSPYTDLERPPLRQRDLERALVRAGSIWTSVTVVPETGSTNADLMTLARAGASEGTVLTTDSQVAGRGRLDRSWVAPPRSGIAVSVLLRPGVPQHRQGWIPLLTGAAVVLALRRVAEVDAGLKWPNDVQINGRKLAGILAERVAGEDAVVVGVGLNVTLRSTELPVPTATSLAIERAECTDRDTLLRAMLRALEDGYERWRSADGDAVAGGLLADYKASCVTLGRQVRVELPGGGQLTGLASDIDESGRLVVAGTPVASGDVIHVR